MGLQPIALIAHTKSENRLAFTLVIDRRPSSRRPPWIWKRQARRVGLKHRGVRLSCCMPPRIGEFAPNPTEPYPYRYLLKELTTATTTIMPTTTSAQIASFEIWSRAQPIICALSFLFSAAFRHLTDILTGTRDFGFTAPPPNLGTVPFLRRAGDLIEHAHDQVEMIVKRRVCGAQR